MTRRPKRAKPKTRFHRCARCHAPVPSGYAGCGSCGYNPGTDHAEQLMRAAKAMFPGSREL